MIKYDKLWITMNRKDVSQYRLLKEGISSSTLNRLKKNERVTTDTLDKLCTILDCRVEDIIEYVKK